MAAGTFSIQQEAVHQLRVLPSEVPQHHGGVAVLGEALVAGAARHLVLAFLRKVTPHC